MKVKELVKQLDQLSPTSYACSWDNVGLLVGRMEQEVHKIIVTLDVTNEVVERAKEERADLIISHHPLIFSNMKRINDETVLGRKLLTLMEEKIACYAMHTNFDIMGGMAQLAEQMLELQNAVPLEVTKEEDGTVEGIGRVGTIKEPMTLKQCAEFVKDKFQIDKVALFGEEDTIVKKIAVCPGSGKGMAKEAIKKGADVLITGDLDRKSVV